MTPWFGTPPSYASGYMSAQRPAALSQSLTVAFNSPPTYCTGFETRGSRGSNMGKTDSTVTVDQGNGIPAGGLTEQRPGDRQTQVLRVPGVEAEEHQRAARDGHV